MKFNMKQLIIPMAILLLNINCDDNPVDVKHENRNPVILSLTVFPDTINPSDSAIVICNAMDPDGDTLVYDWYTDGKSRIKGAPSYQDWILYNTFENWCTIFPKNLNNKPIDTLWIECQARDGKGGGSISEQISFILKQNGGGE